MSRRVNIAVRVHCGEGGAPTEVLLPDQAAPVVVRSVLGHWREWMGVLDGEPERDVWHVETALGVCELHGLRYPTDKPEESPAAQQQWVLFRWED